MEMRSLAEELKNNDYPGRGIIMEKQRMGKRRQRLILLWAAVKTAATGSL